MKFILSPAAIVLGFAPAIFTPAAHAAAIIGEMSFTQGGLNLLDSTLTATTIPSSDAIAALLFIASPSAKVSYFGTSGDYSGAINANVVFQAAPFRFTDGPGLLWTAGAFQFFSESTTAFESDGALRVYVAGFVRAANYDDTPGVWVLTTQGVHTEVTWTSAINTIPEPSITLSAAGAAFLLLRRRRTA